MVHLMPTRTKPSRFVALTLAHEGISHEEWTKGLDAETSPSEGNTTMDAATVLARIDAENLSVSRRTGIPPRIKPWVVTDTIANLSGYGWTLVEAFEDLLFVRESAT